ncbi:hypothetical protein [Salarchaeum sp. JOR-1]|nr:hypothetical protein [Salarchaeum sp. JOR-1]
MAVVETLAVTALALAAVGVVLYVVYSVLGVARERYRDGKRAVPESEEDR